MPYDPVDFVPRPEIDAPGWPIDYASLEPFYRRAQVYADCGPYAYCAGASGLDGELIAGLRSETVRTTTLERWSPPTHFGKLLNARRAGLSTLTVLTGCVVTDLDRAPSGDRIVSVGLTTIPEKHKARIRAERVVLAGGGLETTRLLLSTGSKTERALGDQSGVLGSGYMCHVMGTIARIKLRAETKVIFGFERDAEGIYVRRRLTLSEATLRARALPNMYLLLDRPLVGDASHGSAILSLTYLAKRLLQTQSRKGAAQPNSSALAHLRNLVFGAPHALSVLPRVGRERFLQGRRLPSMLEASRDNAYYLTFHAEQRPLAASRVSLSDDRDAVGMKRLRITPEIDRRDLEGIVETHRVIGEALESSGIGRLEFLGADPVALAAASSFTLGHHIGTTRMARDPSDGVVDANLRVHGMQNLFVASTSTFPTSSQAHPTLTLLALTLRLADHLCNTPPRNDSAQLADAAASP